jgi:hypothetical protein
MPCRGTGRVISNLGGTPNTVACPWCRGSGIRLSGVDAQASWLGTEGESQPAPEGPPDPGDQDESPPAPPDTAA